MDGTAQTLLTLGAVLLVGLLADEASRRLRLPTVTVLLLLGIAVGPEVLDLLPAATDDWFPIVSTIALTMVGFILGGEFTADHLKANGRAYLMLAVVQGIAVAALVALVLLLAGVEVSLALCLAGIAVATAPAATLAVVQERGAEGPFTRALLTVVALDDVIALTLFAVLATVAAAVTASGSVGLMGEAVWEIFGAVGLGLAIGVPAAYLTGRLRVGLPTQEEAYGVVLVCAGLALAADVSFLLAALVMGATIANLAKHHEIPFKEIERIEWPALTVFFVLAGASLEFDTLGGVGVLGAGYIALRSFGKVVGCELGGRWVGLAPEGRRWLGVAMLPQAGVAIGLALLAAEQFPDVAEDVLAVVIASTVVFELTGPVLTRLALTRVGEATALPPSR